MDFKFIRKTLRDVLGVMAQSSYVAAYKIVLDDEEWWETAAVLDPTISEEYRNDEYCDFLFTLDHVLIGDGEVTEVRLYKGSTGINNLVCGIEGLSIRMPNATDDIAFRIRVRARANVYDHTPAAI